MKIVTVQNATAFSIRSAALLLALWAVPATTRGQIFVSNTGNGTIGEFNATSGATVNAALVSGLNTPTGIAVSGGNLFVANFGVVGNGSNGSIGEFNATTGATVNAALISGLNGPTGIAVSGGNLFVANSGDVTLGNESNGSRARKPTDKRPSRRPASGRMICVLADTSA